LSGAKIVIFNVIAMCENVIVVRSGRTSICRAIEVMSNGTA
jgi:hypothetical protein